MTNNEISVRDNNFDYKVIIGKNLFKLLSRKLKDISPKANKIGVVLDKNVPKKYKIEIKKNLKNYKVYFFEYRTNEKFKSFNESGLFFRSKYKVSFFSEILKVSLRFFLP